MSGLFQDDPAEDDGIRSGPDQDGGAAPLPDPPAPGGAGLFGGDLPVALPGPPHTTAYRVLARKYRPATFDDLIGQEAMVRILRNAFAIGRVAHAFMLTGVRGVGKTTTARIIARALNCVGPDGTGGPTADACGVCDNCVAILADRHPDVIEMDAASRTGVDDMREIIEATRFRPMQARTKVFVIDEVHMLSRNAFNALLKTLEEPPPHVKFVFATTELRKVPITVLSRCQRFDLRRVRIAELARHYGRIARQEGVAVEPAALEQIARAADGSVRDGLSILDQAIAQTDGGPEAAISAAQVADMLGLADHERVFELMEAVMAGKPAAALAITDAAFERGADLGTMLQDLLDLLHTVTRIRSIPSLRDSADLPEAERTRGAAIAASLTVPVLARAWQMLLKGVGEVESAPDRRAAAEMVLIRLCHVADMPTPGDLVRRLTLTGAAGSAPVAESGVRAGADSKSMLSRSLDVTASAGTVRPGVPVGVVETPPAAPLEMATAAARPTFAVPAEVAPSVTVQGMVARGGMILGGVARTGLALEDVALGNGAPGTTVPEDVAAGTGALKDVALGTSTLADVAPGEAALAKLPGGNFTRGDAAPADTILEGIASTGMSLETGSPRLAATAAVQPASAEPRLTTFRDVVALVGDRKEAMLHAHLLHSAHLVRFAPPVIELRPQPEAPRDLAPRLAALLSEATGTRWTIALSAAAGEPTLAEQGNVAETARRDAAAEHPLVRAILDTFPGARIATVTDRTTDAYGLPVGAAPDTPEPDMPDFSPPDAAYFDEDPMEIDP